MSFASKSGSGISTSGGASSECGIKVGAIVSRKCDSGFANHAPVIASTFVQAGISHAATAGGTIGGAEVGATLGIAGGPPGVLVGAIVGGLIGGLTAGITALFVTKKLQSTVDWDANTLQKGIHWGVHVGRGKIIELLDDGELHEAWIGYGDWKCNVGIICEGGQLAAHRAEQEYKNNKKQGYNLATNNCRDFCRRCCK